MRSSIRSVRSLLSGLVVGALALLSAAGPVGAAAATTRPAPAWHTPLYAGQDLGWPDCSPAQGGFGMPLPPPTSYRFMIVEVNARYLMQENPCLSSELAYAKRHSNLVGNYHLPDYPNAKELAQSGYWPRKCASGDLLCKTYNSGYQQGTWAVNLLRSKGTSPRFLWVDIEHRREQDWSSNTKANVSLIKGEVAGIRSLGVAVGLYSYPYGWREITGGWHANLPQWVTTGSKTNTAGRVAHCKQAGFTTGPIRIVQSVDGPFDIDTVCPSASRSIKSLFAPNRPLPNPLAPYLGTGVGPGSRGAAVRAVQWATRVPTTGVFDVRTKAAVVAVQHRNGQTADGRVRSSTWRAITP